jgi:hypothetical protein
MISLKLAFAIKTYWVLNPLAVLAEARSLSHTAILTHLPLMHGNNAHAFYMAGAVSLDTTRNNNNTR